MATAPTPTGRLADTAEGVDLELARTVRLPIDEVWAAVTESERTARWLGPWEGTGEPGALVRLQLAFEEGQPWGDMRIDACERPYRLAVAMTDESGDWRMEALLSQKQDATRLRLVHHLDSAEGIEEIGPGWEWYLDRLLAVLAGTGLPPFEDYYPAQRGYFADLAANH